MARPATAERAGREREAAAAPSAAASLQGALGWAALAAAVASALAIGGNKPLAWILLAAAALALMVPQLALDGAGRRLPRRAVELAAPAALWIAVLLWGAFQLSGLAPDAWIHPAWADAAETTGAAGLIGLDPVEGRHVLLRLAIYPVLFWLAFRAATKPERAANFVRAIAVWSALLAAYGITAALTGRNPILEEVTNQRHEVLASFVNSNNYAFYAGMGVMANLAALMLAFEGRGASRGGPTRRLRVGLEALITGWGWVFLIGAGVTAAAMTMTGSRAGVGASLGGVAVFTLIMWLRREGRGLGAAQVAALGAVLLIGLYAAAGGFFDVLDKAMSTGGSEGRFLIYPRILAAIADRPLLGVGPGGFADGFRPYVPFEAATADWRRAHNSYLENAFEFGVPAALAFYLALALVIGRCWRGAMTRRRMAPAPALAVAVSVSGALHSLVDFSLQMPAAAALFAVILGVGFAQSFSNRGR